MILMFLSYGFDSLDGRQARKIKNESPLGELFQESCINLGVVFSILSLCYIIGIRDVMTQWYFAQTASFFLLATHIEALGTKVRSFGRFTGKKKMKKMKKMKIKK
jgi:phosphatidylglycerophosphate synthase